MSYQVTQSYSSELTNCNLLTHVVSVVPEFICQVPEVFYINNLGLKTKMGLPLLLANMKAIGSTWRLARAIGMASVYYCPVNHKLEIKSGYPRHEGVVGQVTLGLLKSAPYDSNSLKTDYEFDGYSRHFEILYGLRHPYYNWGYTILSTKLSELICNYTSTIHSLSQRIAMSFGEAWLLGGVDTNDAPVLEAVQDKMEQDIVNSRRGILPEGSDLKAFSSSLGDFNNVLTPFERGISTESGVPDWLLFPTITSSSFDLESRVIWATNTFNREVLPILANLLYRQGYNVIEINPPTYRDGLYKATVSAADADARYKGSSTEINKQQIDLNEQNMRMAIEQHSHQMEMDRANMKTEGGDTSQPSSVVSDSAKPEVKKRSQGRKL